MLSNEADGAIDHIHLQNHGCFWYVKIISWSLLTLFLAMLGLAKVASHSPPLPSSFSYPEVVVVSERQRTYLEVELENHTDEAVHPYFAINVYFTQLGGWFENTKRTVLYRQTDFNTSDRVQFKKLGTASSPFKVSMPDNTKGEDGGYFIFYPPATYRQGQLIKIDIQHQIKKPAN